MNSNLFPRTIFLILLFSATCAQAQHKISFDLAGIRQMNNGLNGLNLSCFYHFSEHVIGGIEVNRFFSSAKQKGAEPVKLSAWDYDLNFHYLVPVPGGLQFYPLTGVSFTADKELFTVTSEEHVKGEDRRQSFWSFNTGAGLLYEWGRWSPHIEYNFTWGSVNQQFLLAGISYEVDCGRHPAVHHQ